MEIKKFSIAIIGCGSRGAEAYGRIMADQKDRFEIAALCDVNEAKLKKYGGIFGVKADALFSREEEFFAAKRADALVIATMDNDHVRQCEKALQLGYDVLLEKCPSRAARRNARGCSPRTKNTAVKWWCATFSAMRPRTSN